MDIKEIARAALVEHPPGIIASCGKCRTVLKSGRFAVAVLIDPYRYFVGEKPRFVCCGEEKKIPLLFDDEKSAEQAVRQTMQTLDADGTTANLKLIVVAILTSDTVH